jgi:membrane protein implicated in regulation of membrane protease activity
LILLVLALIVPALHFLWIVGVIVAVCGAVLLALSYSRGGPRLY